jgi:hypothetical protein
MIDIEMLKVDPDFDSNPDFEKAHLLVALSFCTLRAVSPGLLCFPSLCGC